MTKQCLLFTKELNTNTAWYVELYILLSVTIKPQNRFIRYHFLQTFYNPNEKVVDTWVHPVNPSIFVAAALPSGDNVKLCSLGLPLVLTTTLTKTYMLPYTSLSSLKQPDLDSNDSSMLFVVSNQLLDIVT